MRSEHDANDYRGSSTISLRVAVVLGGLATAQCFEIEENMALCWFGLAKIQQIVFR